MCGVALIAVIVDGIIIFHAQMFVVGYFGQDLAHFGTGEPTYVFFFCFEFWGVRCRGARFRSCRALKPRIFSLLAHGDGRALALTLLRAPKS